MISKKKNKIVINGVSYKKDIDTIKLRNRYYLKSDVELDTFTNEYELKKNLDFYLGLDNQIHYTSKLIYIKLPNNTIYKTCESILKDYKSIVLNPIDFSEYISTDMYYSFPSFKYTPNKKIYNIDHYNKTLAPYTSQNLPSAYDFLKSYTYGFELETTGIPLNEKFSNDSGFAMLYDGSINGPEYVSSVMKSSNFHHLNDFMKILKSISLHDSSCSFHIHIGNIQYSDDSLLSMYSLFQRLQEDLNLLIAPYKKDYMYLAGKQKDHCQNLPLISPCTINDLKELFYIKNCSRSDLRDYITRGDKWNMRGRYYAVNFLNYICKDYPNNTVEIRSLQMSFSFDYILTWLIINVAIIKYATENIKTVLDKKIKIQLEDCLQYSITDSSLLSIVLENIKNIKNTIYRKKYIEHSMLTNTILLDTLLQNTVLSYNLYPDTSKNFRDKATYLDHDIYYTKIINDVQEYSTDTIVTSYSRSLDGLSLSGLISEISATIRDLISRDQYTPSSSCVKITEKDIFTKDKKKQLYDIDFTIYIINGVVYLVYRENNNIRKIHTFPVPKKKPVSNISYNYILDNINSIPFDSAWRTTQAQAPTTGGRIWEEPNSLEQDNNSDDDEDFLDEPLNDDED